jgi:ribose transport system substrate-binding protein
MMRTRTTSALAVLAVAGAAALAACSTPGGSSAPPAASPAGSSAAGTTAPTAAAAGGQPAAPVKSVKDLKVAYFSAGSSNQYLQAAIAEAKAYAGQEGFSLDVFDGQFDAQTQYNQMQVALTGGKYNAFVVEPNDGNLVCNLLTKQAPAAGVAVSVFNEPICGRATALGEGTWQPGTVTYVGGQTLDVYEAWMQQVKKEYPNGAKIALIAGPSLGANTINFFQAAKALTGKWQVVAKQTTDYTTPAAFQAAQTIVRSNPGLNVIMSNYSGMSQGVVQATTGTKVAVFDFGGDQWALSQVKSGKLRSTIIMLPRQETKDALQAVVDLVQGQSVPKFINLATAATLPGANPFVYQSNVGQYKAEY